jgi:class I fructose-bisphosphate aldolase
MESDRAILEMVKGAMAAGAAGTSIGRNVFQHKNPTKIVGALCMIVHEKAGVDEALEFLNKE